MKIFIYLLINVFLFLVLLLHPYNARSQQQEETTTHDSSFYAVYPNSLTTRFYFSQKYTAFTIKGGEGVKDIRYRPNSNLNMGVGATYRNFSLNLAYHFGFLNQDKEKGKTHYLDLQGHIYPQKWTVDWFGQFYKGYYLYPKGYGSENEETYYRRSDQRVNLFGLAAYRVLNNRRFSYRAAMLQNEWQKKSAGSLLLGAEAHYGIIKADSAFVPHNLEKEFSESSVYDVRFLSIGPGVGYAHTLVFQKHFFVTGSVTLNFNLSFASEKGTAGKQNKTALDVSSLSRVATGYNGRIWDISANWIENELPVKGGSLENKYFLHTGNFRLILAKKLVPGPKLKKHLSFVDKILK